MRWLAYLAAAGVALLLAVMFAIALPDAAARAREGWHRSAESACETLLPAPDSPVLGVFPRPAPDFTLKDWAGHDVTLSSLRGTAVIVNFWATWCPPCREEIASLEKLATNMKSKPFRLLAVSVDDDWPTVRKFFAKGTPLEVLLDTARATPKLYGTEKFPESFLVDKDGNIRYFVVSNRDWSTPEVQQCLESLAD